MAFDKSSTLLATSSADSSVKVWDVIREYCTNNLNHGSAGVVRSAFIAYSSAVCTEFVTNKLHLLYFGFSLCAFHPDSDRLQLVTAASQLLRVWQLQSKGKYSDLTGHVSAVTCIQFSPNGKTMYR